MNFDAEDEEPTGERDLPEGPPIAGPSRKKGDSTCSLIQTLHERSRMHIQSTYTEEISVPLQLSLAIARADARVRKSRWSGGIRIL